MLGLVLLAVVAAKTPLVDFTYRWPRAAALPVLDRRLRADAARQRADAQREAAADRRDRPAGAPFLGHSFQRTWRVEGTAGGLLSLSSETYRFTGGAHGNTEFGALLWDRTRRREMPLAGLFREPKAAMARLAGLFCPALDRERLKRRGEPTPPDALFGDCPPLTNLALAPTAPKGGRFTAIRVLIGPYQAGPYAEGSYELVLPLDPVLLAR